MRRASLLLTALFLAQLPGSVAMAQAPPEAKPAPALAPAAKAEPAPAPAAEAELAGQVLVLMRQPAPHLRPGADYGGAYGNGAIQAAQRRGARALARANGLTLVEDWSMPMLGVDCFVMAVPAGRSPAAVAATLSVAAGVAWSQPRNVFAGRQGGAVAAVPNDPLFAAQPAASQWHLADLHALADGRGVEVAIIDSQIERGHPDLAGQVAAAADFAAAPSPGEAHGTAVAGIIAARAGNGVGIAGIAPRARLLALRACWQRRGGTDTVCDSLTLAKALHRAIERGADIINLSLGGPSDLLLARLIDAATARGATVVAAFDRSVPGGGFPASHPGVVAVADSAAGPPPPGVWTAPGQGIPTPRAGGGWQLVNGSSYAAAHVSGLFALLHGMAARGPARAQLVGGAGVIDACATLLRRVGGAGRQCPAAPRMSAGLRD